MRNRNDPAYQSDLDLGPRGPHDNRLRVPLVLKLDRAEAVIAVQKGIAAGHKRENPNWPDMTEREQRIAIQHWVETMINEELKR